jgi:hypothetical protein
MDIKQFKLDVMKFYSTMKIPEDFDFRIDMYQNALKETMLSLIKEVQAEKLLNQIPVSFKIDVKTPVNWFQHLKLDLNKKFGWNLKVRVRTKTFSQDKVIEVNTYLKYPQLRNNFGEGVKTVVSYDIFDRGISTFSNKERPK